MAEDRSDPINETDVTRTGSRITLRKLAFAACLVGAAGSIGLFLLASQQAPILIIVLFVGWLAAPFVMLFLALSYSKRWSKHTQTALYYVTLLIAGVSLAIYGYQVLWPRPATPAFYWVAVPPASVTLMLVVVSIAAMVSRRNKGLTL
jgi:hypothetical protein